MARGLRTPKGDNEVDRHHMHIGIGFADESADVPGQATATVGINDEKSRKTKGDDYTHLTVKCDAQLMNMKFGEALDYLLLQKLAHDEQQAAEAAAKKASAGKG